MRRTRIIKERIYERLTRIDESAEDSVPDHEQESANFRWGDEAAMMPKPDTRGARKEKSA